MADLQWWFGLGLFQSMWPESMGRKIACSFWDIMRTMKSMKQFPGRGELGGFILTVLPTVVNQIRQFNEMYRSIA